MTVAIKKFGNANGYAYGYDQLNRIKKLDTWNTTTANGLPSTWTLKTAYQERVSYDPNGNIKSYTRNQQAGTLMDNLSYSYYAGTNQLQRVADAVAATVATTDIDNQTVTNNYVYDGVGNLVKDTSEALNVTWSPYGKVLSAVRKRTVAPAVDIQTHFGYDAMQNRIQKTYISVTDTTRTYYIRDAQGNVMAVYQRRRDTVIWQEQHLYGSSRLGTWEPNQRLTPSVDTSKKWQIREGQKRYELTNHLGNVLVTVSDRRQGAAPVSQQFTYYEAVVITATDYYPFGLEMPGRTFQSGNYRYGFNGKENDRNGSWSGNQLVQDYGFRLYNPAIGKFLSVDPITKDYPELTPYQFASDCPISAIDLDGLEIYNPFTGKGFGPLSAESIRQMNKQGQFLIDATTGKGYPPIQRPEPVIKVVNTVSMPFIDGHGNSVSVKITKMEAKYTSYYTDTNGKLVKDEESVSLIHFRADMDVCTDGCGASHGDPTHMDNNETAFPKADGSIYNADKDNYIVLPTNLIKKFDIKKNTLSFTEHGGKVVISQFGETNSDQKIGEASWKHVGEQGFNPDPMAGYHGGLENFDVNYWVKLNSTGLSDGDIQKLLPALERVRAESEKTQSNNPRN
jgi:RHS repeat-associated protein